MKKKHLTILIIVAAVLLLGFAVFEYRKKRHLTDAPTSKPSTDEPPIVDQGPVFDPGLTLDDEDILSDGIVNPPTNQRTFQA